MGQTQSTEVVVPKSKFRPKKYLNKLELVSMQCIFDDMSTDGVIELKGFLDYLKFPSELEPAAILLFKSLSYLGSYPDLEGPTPLTFTALITAYIILSGRLEEDQELRADTMFFESLSVSPPHHEKKKKEVTKKEESSLRRESTGLSLAELGIAFDDMKLEEDEIEHRAETEILARDLTTVFSLFLWLGNIETEDFSKITETAEKIVRSQSDSTDTVKFSRLKSWIEHYAPHIFTPMQSFITKQFTFYPTPNDPHRLLLKDRYPIPNQSDILTPVYTTLLSWAIPEQALASKTWTRLYSASQDGFSMNRFESHVFKYPGPTVMLIQADNILLSAYISQPWKHSKSQYWGDSSCFLFEIYPDLDIYRPSQRKHLKANQHYIYYHHAYGIGMGGNQQHLPSPADYEFNLFLENNLQRGTFSHEAYSSFPTYESTLKPSQSFIKPFDVVNIEVFGLGGEKERAIQAKEWLFETQEAARRAGLNIRKTDGELDKELLKMAGIIDMDSRQDR
ncbi:TLD-domain-containing protein [Pilobolus umbonatus]|nr:TLD-domain-containing protein [Pilobolus umbonatus]